jgi:hypothetical protein
MKMTVANTNPDAPRVTLFGRLEGGGHVAEVMNETSVPYAAYWENSVEQVMVYIEPDAEQLTRMTDALNDGRLKFSALQNYGSSNGGVSEITIED